MTLDLGENTVKFLLCMSKRCEILRFKDFLENGRFDLENIGQGQLVMHHFSQKNKPKNVTKKYLRFFDE